MLRAVAQLLVTQPPTLSHSLPLAQSKGESVFEDSDLHVRLPGGVENLNAPLFALPGLGKQGAAGPKRAEGRRTRPGRAKPKSSKAQGEDQASRNARTPPGERRGREGARNP